MPIPTAPLEEVEVKKGVLKESKIDLKKLGDELAKEMKKARKKLSKIVY